ncbi:hypothetical protein CsSME_00015136 [Camellia sinensis var. sinensis]
MSYFVDATYFIEVDRLLRLGGYIVISGPPIQWPKQDKEWADLQAVARAFLMGIHVSQIKMNLGLNCVMNRMTQIMHVHGNTIILFIF